MSTGSVAVVTGASSDIGASIAKMLAEEGHHVALLGRSESRLDVLRGQIEAAGGTASARVLDLSDRRAVLAFEPPVGHGPVRAVVNVAGVWHDAEHAFYGPLLHETDAAEIGMVMEVGIMAPMLLTRALLPGMLEEGGGTVINLSGTFADGGGGWMHYFVSKRALEQFTVGLADEMGQRGVRVNCVSPADVATEPYVRFFPEDAATALRPRSVADVVRWLVSPDAQHINGQIIEVRAETRTDG